MIEHSGQRAGVSARVLGAALVSSFLCLPVAKPCRCQVVETPTPAGIPTSQAEDGSTDHTQHPVRRHALILVGLPGDAAHQEQFNFVAAAWRSWLLESLHMPAENVHVLNDAVTADEPREAAATREAIETQLDELKGRLSAEDSLWVFFLGHANYDGQAAAFHIPGPDLKAADYARLVGGLQCREQVFWLTMSSSGWFVEPLSRQGRVVISATQADAEPNETEFPLALVDVMNGPIEQLDRDADGAVSLLELFGATVERVEQRYAADQRAPTEHATLDDNGDGRGSEWKALQKAIQQDVAGPSEEPTQANAAETRPAEAPGGLVDAPTAPPVPAPPRDGDVARQIITMRQAADAAAETQPSPSPEDADNQGEPSE